MQMHVFSKVNIMTGLFLESGLSTGFPKSIFTDICRCASIIDLDFLQDYVRKKQS